MKQIILLTFIQRDKLRSLPPEIFGKCVCLGSGKVTNNLYTWRYSTTVEVAMALRLMGLCIFEEQNEEKKPDRSKSGRQRKSLTKTVETP
jgi:hypothetical protein